MHPVQYNERKRNFKTEIEKSQKNFPTISDNVSDIPTNNCHKIYSEGTRHTMKNGRALTSRWGTGRNDSDPFPRWLFLDLFENDFGAWKICSSSALLG